MFEMRNYYNICLYSDKHLIWIVLPQKNLTFRFTGLLQVTLVLAQLLRILSQALNSVHKSRINLLSMLTKYLISFDFFHIALMGFPLNQHHPTKGLNSQLPGN